jgi:hypothetical protein
LSNRTRTVEEDGTVISTKRIYICGSIINARSRRDIIAGISHELAHLVSSPASHVGDTLRGHSSRDEALFQIGVYDHIFNAENYAWFTWRSFEGKFPF